MTRGDIDLPIAFASTILLRLVGIGVDGTGLGEVLGKDILIGMAIAAALGVVLVAELVGAGHYGESLSSVVFIEHH